MEFKVNQDYNPSFRNLKSALKDKDIELIKTYAHEVHEMAHHFPDKPNHRNMMTPLMEKYNSSIWNQQYTKKYEPKRSIAFMVYHTTRIEDINMNTLIAKQEQVFFENNIQAKLNIPYSDTGNAWSNEDMDKFNSSINIDELLKYRLLVANRSKQIIDTLTLDEIKRKPDDDDINRLKGSSVSEDEGAIWLLDYWKNKTIGQLLLMPLTRHQAFHLNECIQ